ncbi:rRNA-processing protein fcf1, variant 2 [Aspergillus wentii]
MNWSNMSPKLPPTCSSPQTQLWDLPTTFLSVCYIWVFEIDERLVADNQFEDTNFVSHTIRSKLDMLPAMMDLLYAKCIPTFTDCTIAELEKLGEKYRLALRIAKDPRWERLRCDHAGTYADDCIVDRISKQRIYIVGTNDKDLIRRIRKIPGVPIMRVARAKYTIEKLPDALD